MALLGELAGAHRTTKRLLVAQYCCYTAGIGVHKHILTHYRAAGFMTQRQTRSSLQAPRALWLP